MAKSKLTAAKALEMIKNPPHGKKLTPKQNAYFHLVAEGRNKYEGGGWLEKYADGGWVGEGYTNKGNNYNPAWNGQFADGGKLQYYQHGLDFKPKTISKNGSNIGVGVSQGHFLPQSDIISTFNRKPAVGLLTALNGANISRGNMQMKDQLHNLKDLTTFENFNKKMQDGGTLTDDEINARYREYTHSPEWYAKSSGRAEMTDSPIDMMLMGWAGGKGIDAVAQFIGKKVIPNIGKLLGRTPKANLSELELSRVYNGSNRPINIDDIEIKRPISRTGTEGYGFYLTDVPENAGRYAKKMAVRRGGDKTINEFTLGKGNYKQVGINEISHITEAQYNEYIKQGVDALYSGVPSHLKLKYPMSKAYEIALFNKEKLSLYPKKQNGGWLSKYE